MHIQLAHGSGGRETARLIEEIFLPYFKNPISEPMEDAAVFTLPTQQLAFTTDSYVVRPLFFPGGDIGRLSVCGTVNDLLTAGAKPVMLSAAFILEEGLCPNDLRRICRSMADAAQEAGVQIVTGDTKVVEGNGGLSITTSGIGVLEQPPVTFRDAAVGDAILVSGSLGNHHACILSQRLKMDNTIRSDAAPLVGMVSALRTAGIPLHGMRDITRGGLATILNEIGIATSFIPLVEEAAIPVDVEVAAFVRILGLDPLTMGNEGKLLLLVPAHAAQQALHILHASPYGADAALIGHLTAPEAPHTSPLPVLQTALGGRRLLPPLMGEGLPRIC